MFRVKDIRSPEKVVLCYAMTIQLIGVKGESFMYDRVVGYQFITVSE